MQKKTKHIGNEKRMRDRCNFRLTVRNYIHKFQAKSDLC